MVDSTTLKAFTRSVVGRHRQNPFTAFVGLPLQALSELGERGVVETTPPHPCQLFLLD